MDHQTKMLNDAEALLDPGSSQRTQLREMLQQSVLLAALENVMKLDSCPVLRSAARARYLDLTDGKAPQ